MEEQSFEHNDVEGRHSMDWADVIKLVASIVACEGAGGIGAIFTTPAILTWYAGLKKPSLTPPNSVFVPVWIILYLLMGIAVFMVWREGLSQEGVKVAFIVFWVQLVLNVLWSAIFFGLKSLPGGVVAILVLWIAVLITIIEFFWRVTCSRGASYPVYSLGRYCCQSERAHLDIEPATTRSLTNRRQCSDYGLIMTGKKTLGKHSCLLCNGVRLVSEGAWSQSSPCISSGSQFTGGWLCGPICIGFSVQ